MHFETAVWKYSFISRARASELNCCEIAVKSADLTPEETKRLLKKK